MVSIGKDILLHPPGLNSGGEDDLAQPIWSQIFIVRISMDGGLWGPTEAVSSHESLESTSSHKHTR